MANLEIDDQVREVVDDMLANRWFPGPSHAEKAEKWGVTISVVWRRASEASRFIRLCCRASAEDIRDESLRNVGRIGVKAELGGQYRDALNAQELFLRVHGLLERQRTAPEEPEHVDTGELRELIEKAEANEHAGKRATETADGRSGADREGEGRAEEEGEGRDEA